MKRRTFVAAAAASLPLFAFAQAVPPRIAFVSYSTPRSYGHLLDEFREGLRALGYVEGRNVVLDVWWAQNRAERLEPMIAEMLLTKPAVIVGHGSLGIIQLRKATSSVPIVFAAVGDPVGQGLIASFAHPGGNVTGVAFNEEVIGKVYELTRIVIPRISRVGWFLNPDDPAARHHQRLMASARKSLSMELIPLQVRSVDGLVNAFAKAKSAKAQAIVVPAHAPFSSALVQLAELQFKHAIPTFHSTREGLEAGGLASYSFPLEENFRRAAAYVDQILKGRSPGDIPVEIPTRYEIAINMATAKALGIKVPETALMRAGKVIN